MPRRSYPRRSGSHCPEARKYDMKLLRYSAALLLLASSTANAQHGPHDAQVAPIMTKALADFPGKERSEEHTAELQSLMRISDAAFGLKKQKPDIKTTNVDK